jgi:translation elongation factor EF-1beta
MAYSLLFGVYALPVLIEGPDDHGGYGHCAEKAEGEEGVEENQVWALGLGFVFLVRGLGGITHI